MSVRREAVGEHSGRGAGLMKNAFFWMAMLTASFLLGFLVIAPLMQLTRGKTDSSSPSASQQGAGRKPSPAAANAAVPLERRKVNVPPDEPVTITPDRTLDSDPSVQPAGDPTEPGADRSSSRANDTSGSSESDRGPGPAGAGASQPENADESSGSDRSRRRDADTSDRATRRNGDGHETASETTRRSRRSDVGRDEASPRRSTTRPEEDSTIQRGESIDR